MSFDVYCSTIRNRWEADIICFNQSMNDSILWLIDSRDSDSVIRYKIRDKILLVTTIEKTLVVIS